MKITRKTFGTLSNGKKTHLLILSAGDLRLCISEYGAAWTELLVPSAKGERDDILLGYSTLQGYTQKGYFGATIGRFANRVNDGKFTLDGCEYNLPKNNGKNSLHGGRHGFDKRLWKGEAYKDNGEIFARFELDSPDGDEGYPGHLHAVVTYGLTKANEVIAEYKATVDKNCPVNLTNHAYFNLAGEGNGKILDHELKLFSSSYIPVDKTLIPTGEILPVKGTPFDFTSRRAINAVTADNGYDHCFVIDGEFGNLRPAAEVFERESGRTMHLFTTQPGLQFYAGGSITETLGKDGAVYGANSGFCLETQHYPDSPNQPSFPSTIFGPERDYNEKTVYTFN
ncbi:aldose 1-epimerase [Spirochaetia bacterium]|nr:aldose 1-epimerase [Spirochaetia bacterium]GHV83665.1 aldose 1-epimerase [Spirochaetia bacterium]